MISEGKRTNDTTTSHPESGLLSRLGGCLCSSKKLRSQEEHVWAELPVGHCWAGKRERPSARETEAGTASAFGCCWKTCLLM